MNNIIVFIDVHIMFPNKKIFPVTEHCLDYVTVINFACIIIETKIMNFELATHSANMFKITPEAISEDTNLKFFWGRRLRVLH